MASRIIFAILICGAFSSYGASITKKRLNRGVFGRQNLPPEKRQKTITFCVPKSCSSKNVNQHSGYKKYSDNRNSPHKLPQAPSTRQPTIEYKSTLYDRHSPPKLPPPPTTRQRNTYKPKDPHKPHTPFDLTKRVKFNMGAEEIFRDTHNCFSTIPAYDSVLTEFTPVVTFLNCMAATYYLLPALSPRNTAEQLTTKFNNDLTSSEPSEDFLKMVERIFTELLSEIGKHIHTRWQVVYHAGLFLQKNMACLHESNNPTGTAIQIFQKLLLGTSSDIEKKIINEARNRAHQSIKLLSDQILANEKYTSKKASASRPKNINGLQTEFNKGYHNNKPLSDKNRYKLSNN
eukprot:186078_1